MIPQEEPFDFTNPRVRAARRLLENLLADVLFIFRGQYYDRRSLVGMLKSDLIRAERARLVKARIDGDRSRFKGPVQLPMMFIRTDSPGRGRLKLVVVHEAIVFVRAKANFEKGTAQIEFRIDPSHEFELSRKLAGASEFVLIPDSNIRQAV